MNLKNSVVFFLSTKSDEKITRVKTAIQKLLDNGERISVPRLMEMTGLSGGFFYKNPIVRKEINDAVEWQTGIIDPRRKILDQVMDKNIELLHQQIAKLQQENKRLKSERGKMVNWKRVKSHLERSPKIMRFINSFYKTGKTSDSALR